MTPWMLWLLGLALACALMTVLWLVQRRTGDAGIVDAGWFFGIGALTLIFTLGSPWGNLDRRLILAVVAVSWSVRLGSHVVQRLLTLPEDGRYTAAKKSWGPKAQSNMFAFYQVQALACALFALPMLIAAQSPEPLGAWDACGCAIAAVALIGEWIADRQLSRFRADSSLRGQVCQVGLWKYSRHPNYFFEWLHWWAYVCFAATAPWGWLTWFLPFLMLYLILFVTGIPPTEAQALRTRGDAYRRYQELTSPFIPLPRRKPSSVANPGIADKA